MRAWGGAVRVPVCVFAPGRVNPRRTPLSYGIRLLLRCTICVPCSLHSSVCRVRFIACASHFSPLPLPSSLSGSCARPIRDQSGSPAIPCLTPSLSPHPFLASPHPPHSPLSPEAFRVAHRKAEQRKPLGTDSRAERYAKDAYDRRHRARLGVGDSGLGPLPGLRLAHCVLLLAG